MEGPLGKSDPKYGKGRARKNRGIDREKNRGR
jgi:hypothetical protein